MKIGVFNAREAFAKLSGRTFNDFSDLRSELLKMRIEHLQELPPGTGPDALYDIAVKNGWVKSFGSSITIKVGIIPSLPYSGIGRKMPIDSTIEYDKEIDVIMPSSPIDFGVVDLSNSSTISSLCHLLDSKNLVRVSQIYKSNPDTVISMTFIGKMADQTGKGMVLSGYIPITGEYVVAIE